MFCLYWDIVPLLVASIDWISGYWDIRMMSKVGCGFPGCQLHVTIRIFQSIDLSWYCSVYIGTSIDWISGYWDIRMM